ncbi:lipid IV(A) 3-deoxy-D-manno-octulosonic acid transferase [Marinobacter salicampi]|uniref:lipid IV(A) 3-deoxy-D-manno-octulosonic acid transferase n=1 Tax=Marinobacter salicampi TaxID=435907 RepID=UPI00140B8912|nr:lipid IV(A) 3-deoxy-D-manno-octulosonic acid transferase [Marinobacter salicampi]
MLHFLYSLFFRMALPFVLLRLWWQGRDSREAMTHWRQRLGYLPRSEQPVIWVHAVSVGETIAAAPLVEALLVQVPQTPILMSAMTATGNERARSMFGDRVSYAYSPYDTPGSVRRFLDRARPKALVIMETELWPNMISLSHKRGLPIFLINARLSERSARGYGRVLSLVRPLLGSITWIAAQAGEDARRFLSIGARPESVSVTGSIKFDVAIPAEIRAAADLLRGDVLGRQRPVWIAASTHDGEDQQILEAHRLLLAKHTDALLILVPRHPERFEAVAALVKQSPFTLARRSEGASAKHSEVYLADSMGELLMLYGAADVAFVGGSLIERGGHNPLEPAAWGMPVVSGPHVFNFETIYGQLADGGAFYSVANAEELASCVMGLFDAPESAARSGHNARMVVDANRGALDRVVAGIIDRV